MKQEKTKLDCTIISVNEEEVVLRVEHLSKIYRLGEVGTGTISHDLNRWWARVRGKEDPFSKVGATNDRTQKAEKGEYVKVLDNINFEVKKGEVLGIIGKNGAGKSTLLKVISQITAPTFGAIKAKGRIASLLEVGTGMNPEMTGKENVYLNGTILGMTKKEIDAKYDEIMEFAGCAKYSDTPVKRYSSGMKVRLGFAVAAFLEPEILIVDEVLAVGDAEFQKKAIGKMKEISSGGGRTVLFVSHNMASIQNLCDRGLLLKNGQVEFIGDIEDTITQYLTMDAVLKVNTNNLDTSQRKGNGLVQLLTISTARNLNDLNNIIEDAVTGKPFFIKLNYNSKVDIGNVIFSIGFFTDVSKTFVTALRSDCITKVFDLKKGEGQLIFKIDKFPFMEGRYSLNFLIKDNIEQYDWLRNACTINVINGDFYGTGILPNSGKEGVCLNFEIL
ncbi:ABC transporter ATP-binding protein [Mangrovimonas sp. DI 80]|uniref:ABC transporter ATP-binding protein n=1 Tax=Mangrovimonas sp. DI 80 TaxID=1779330 RepID=UPI0009769495|nr:ABC transporter ATP-binding protein [Mangrovimonas sp. DI 80]OMP31798.1 hypothetical protein BKM32_01685 [Mangrovimonas sp. DI 80]